MAVEVEHLVDADQIRVLLAIAEAGSFSGAAVRLGVSQPSVSQQVKRIEGLIGRALFQRRRTGVELTSDGEAVVIFARAMQSLTEDLRRQLSRADETVRVVFGMAEDFCRTALPAVLWLFARSNPLVELQVLSGRYSELLAALENRTIDFVIMRRHSRLPGATRLWGDRADWIGRADLQLLPDGSVPLVMPVEPNPVRDLAITTLQQAGLPWRIVFEGTSLTAVEAALQVGLGVCTAPNRMRMPGVERIGQRLGLPALPDVEYVLAMQPGEPGGAVKALIEVIRHAARSSFD